MSGLFRNSSLGLVTQEAVVPGGEGLTQCCHFPWLRFFPRSYLSEAHRELMEPLLGACFPWAGGGGDGGDGRRLSLAGPIFASAHLRAAPGKIDSASRLTLTCRSQLLKRGGGECFKPLGERNLHLRWFSLIFLL